MTGNLKRNAKKFLPLAQGGGLVLMDMLGADKSVPWDSVNRNVYRIDVRGDVVWQIQTRAGPSERFPFTNIYRDENGGIRAYCWDGGEYRIDVDSGEIDAGKLAK